MNELDSEFTVELPAQVQQVQLTPGQMLREAREEKGLTAHSLASSMKVPLKKIEAIESNQFEMLPDMVFARALALSICRHLKIDADPILKQFPPSVAHHLKSDEAGINTPFRPSQEVSKFKFVNILTRPVALFSFVVILAALSLYIIPSIFSARSGAKPSAVVPQVNLAPATEERGMPPSAAPLAAASEASLALGPGVVGSVLNEGGGVAAGSVTSGGYVVFKSRGVTWVEVLDAKGAVQLRKTLVAGEVVGAYGALPLTVVVGKADAVDVTVAGKPFNLISVAKDNIARFEVN
jgi:cytoskeleton protein RodZ